MTENTRRKTGTLPVSIQPPPIGKEESAAYRTRAFRATRFRNDQTCSRCLTVLIVCFSCNGLHCACVAFISKNREADKKRTYFRRHWYKTLGGHLPYPTADERDQLDAMELELATGV